MAVSREIEENAMIRYFKTDNQRIQEEEKIGDGVWVQMLQPTHQECAEIAEVLNVDIEDIQAALDEEESSRIELQDGYTLILVDIPTVEIRHEKQSYTTIPLGIILTQDVIVTVCTDDTPVLQNFVNNRVKEFSTKKKMRFVYQILFRTATNYQMNLRVIDKKERRSRSGSAKYRGYRSDRPSRIRVYVGLLCDIPACKWRGLRPTDQV